MKGPEHYRTAENLLTNQRHRLGGSDSNPMMFPNDERALMIAEAQAHATLALTAACTRFAGSVDGNSWTTPDWAAVTE